jgi:calcineurin-like phosphoesterase family protein
MSKVWFTSDHHFGHENIIKYCNRPFVSVDEMNRAMIVNYNSVVAYNDVVYFVGDVGFMQEDVLVTILSRLNGMKILIYGNHDKVIRKAKDKFDRCFASMHEYLEVSLDRQKFILCHYPMLSWNGSGRGNIMLHGHAHGNTNYGHIKDMKIMDVGVDCHNYFPISADDVMRMMAKKKSEDFGRDRDV